MRALLLHGFAGAPASWDEVIAAGLGALEPTAVTLPGHGGPMGASWQDNLDAVPTDDAEIAIGYSFGARVALGLLASGRIPRAILIGVNPGIPDVERPARRAADAVWARMLRDQGIAAFVAAWEALP
nr:alpha/beta fold hydrolase [Deltaproteobacteria bacterium]